MILYLDASALVKRYVIELGTAEVNRVISGAELVGTALLTRAEVVAALAKSVRVGLLLPDDAARAVRVFTADWPDLARIQITELLIARAGEMAWDHGLRGYDAVQLAAASVWQDAMGEGVTIATFDRHLWQAALNVGLTPFPANLPALLQDWQAR